MNFIKIGNEKWDFVDTQSEETNRPIESGLVVELPKEWHVLGPFKPVKIGCPGLLYPEAVPFVWTESSSC